MSTSRVAIVAVFIFARDDESIETSCARYFKARVWTIVGGIDVGGPNSRIRGTSEIPLRVGQWRPWHQVSLWSELRKAHGERDVGRCSRSDFGRGFQIPIPSVLCRVVPPSLRSLGLTRQEYFHEVRTTSAKSFVLEAVRDPSAASCALRSSAGARELSTPSARGRPPASPPSCCCLLLLRRSDSAPPRGARRFPLAPFQAVASFECLLLGVERAPRAASRRPSCAGPRATRGKPADIFHPQGGPRSGILVQVRGAAGDRQVRSLWRGGGRHRRPQPHVEPPTTCKPHGSRRWQ